MTIDRFAWPDSWRVVPLWSLFSRVKDVGHPDEQMLSVYRDHGVVLKDGRVDNFNKTAENRNIYQLVNLGWLVVNRMKAWQGSLGISPYRGIVSGHYICFRPQHGEDPRFLNYLLRSPAYSAELRRLSRGVRPNQIEIDNEWLRVLPVCLPSLDGQQAIADFLDTETARIDALITKKRRMIALLEERKAGVMLAAAGGRLTHPGPFEQSSLAWLNERPTHWREVLIRLVAKTGSGHTPSRERPEWWEDASIPWITTGEVAQVRSDQREEIVERKSARSGSRTPRQPSIPAAPSCSVGLPRRGSPGSWGSTWLPVRISPPGPVGASCVPVTCSSVFERCGPISLGAWRPGVPTRRSTCPTSTLCRSHSRALRSKTWRSKQRGGVSIRCSRQWTDRASSSLFSRNTDRR